MGNQESSLKAVVHLADGSLIKGFLNGTSDSLEKSASSQLSSGKVELQLTTGKKQTVALDSAKALFFVRSFEGDPEHHEIKFFQTNPETKGLWVRVSFHDNETIEGVVQNSISFVVNPGFFLKPPDPQSNNQMIYAVKKSLQTFQVLGIRTDY